MSQPIIFSIDDDPQVLRAITRDLRNQFRSTYRVLNTTSATEALDSLIELKNQGETVALFVSDNRMPEMQGVAFLGKAKEIFPAAKRVLLTAYSDTEAAIKAINEVQLDYYLLKPWDPPEEKLFPVLNDLSEDWEQNYNPPFKGLKLIGYQFSPKSHQLKDFLSGNIFPYQWLDIQAKGEAGDLLKINQLEEKQLPVVFLEDGKFFIQPTVQELAQALGLNTKASAELYDTVIIGAGPAGLAAAVYAASEGLKTLLIDKRAPGGQAGTNSRIENYLGFPKGLSGADLTRRAITQATRFGTEFLFPLEVTGMKFNGPYKTIALASGKIINTKSVVITTGVNFRHLKAPGMEKLLGAGIYYGAANTEAAYCQEKKVMVVGGGNSAGQAAMYLSKFAKDWVPEVPMSIQTTGDFNTVNPFMNAEAMIRKEKFPKRLVMKSVYNQLDKPTKKARRNYQKYLGKITSKTVVKNIPGYVAQTFYESNHYVRTGNTVVLTPDDAYLEDFPDNPKTLFPHHFHAPYLRLASQLPEPRP